MVRFQSGATALLEDPYLNAGIGLSGSSAAATDYVLKVQMIDGGGSGTSGDLLDADILAGAIVASIGSAFPNGSDGADVGENYVYPSTHTNFLTTMRKKCSVTGKDLTDVTWIENNGSKLWYFTKEQMMMDEFMYQQELQRWYGRRTVTDSTIQRPGAYSSGALGTSRYSSFFNYNWRWFISSN